ncbi:hypothetical protein GC194_14660 [bacterium]|nr:hypothetical protein [bacterium]
MIYGAPHIYGTRTSDTGSYDVQLYVTVRMENDKKIELQTAQSVSGGLRTIELHINSDAGHTYTCPYFESTDVVVTQAMRDADGDTAVEIVVCDYTNLTGGGNPEKKRTKLIYLDPDIRGAR